jgi:hypothetical protein
MLICGVFWTTEYILCTIIHQNNVTLQQQNIYKDRWVLFSHFVLNVAHSSCNAEVSVIKVAYSHGPRL